MSGDPGARSIQRFQVAIKGLLVRDGRLLVVREAQGERWWEFPGGRIDVGEEELPQEEVLFRELREELGPRLTCVIGPPLVTWTRPLYFSPGEYGLLVGFACTQVAGDIELSAEHCDARWVTRRETDALVFAPGYARAFDTLWRRLDALAMP